MPAEAPVTTARPFRKASPGNWCGALLILLTALAGCATPGERIDAEAADLGFTRHEVSGAAFRHVVYMNDMPDRSGALHVYLEGDGSPWIRERWVASDPTPRNPLMLGLMSLDQTSSLYLGRPCYLGTSGDPACDPVYWTSARYSPAVLDSTGQALRRVMEDFGSTRLVLIGHSGGGALAMLLAGRLDETVSVITLGGNLDTDAWTAHHVYSPLEGSLNPASQPPLDPRIRQIHLVGENDTVVPPDMLRHALPAGGDETIRVIPEYDHVCCWTEIWSEVLRLAAPPKSAPGKNATVSREPQ
ncbi:MAG: alpha/beta hydrolase [Pseudomonadota bacterium]|nr:alpha/beta hydrolase [Pseudomonadota bacterium]